MVKAKKDADSLRQKMVEMQRKTYCVNCKDHTAWTSTFHRFLASRSWAHLRVTFNIYHNTFKSAFWEDIPKFFESWYREALGCIHDYAVDSNRFFAMALMRDVRWYNEDSWGYAYGVARVFTWRSEIDLGDIAKRHFEQHYPTFKIQYSLSEFVQKYLEFFNENAMNALIGILH